MNKSLLTIAIPTFNREEILDEALNDLIPKISKYEFDIVVCDNASTDNTVGIVDKYKSMYKNITYFKQSWNIFDKNFITCYELAKTEYIWLLGDSSRIEEKYLALIVDLLNNNNLDALVMNAHSRVKNITSKFYYEPNELMQEIGWHLGLISSSIISKKMTSKEFHWRYSETNFIHFGLFIEYMCVKERTKIYWLNEQVADHTKMKKTATSWLSRSFEVYGKGYVAFVLSLPSQVPIDTKLKCIKDHSLEQGIFEVKNIFAMKAKGWLQYKEIKKYKMYFPFLTNTRWSTVMVISLLPISFVKFMRTLYLATYKA